MKANQILVSVLMGLLLLVPLSRADVIFSNLGAGGTYSTGPAWSICNFSNCVITMGPAFSVSGTYNLTSIDLALLYSNFPGSTNGLVTLTLYTDASGTPGRALESWILSSVPAYGSPNGTLVTLPSGPLVLSDATYWLIGSASFGVWDLWMENLGGTDGPVYRNGTVSKDHPMPAFRVNGTPVPEPGTLVLFASSLMVLADGVRRKLLG